MKTKTALFSSIGVWIFVLAACSLTQKATQNATPLRNPYNAAIGSVGFRNGVRLSTGFQPSYGAEPVYIGIGFQIQTLKHTKQTLQMAGTAGGRVGIVSAAATTGGARPLSPSPAGSASPASTETSKTPSAGADISGDTSHDSEATYKLINMEGNVVQALNSPTNAQVLQSLQTYGRRARIVTSVWQTQGYTSHTVSHLTLAADGTYSVSGPANASVRVSGSGSEDIATTLSDGTIFNYVMSRICWAREKGTGRIVVGALIPETYHNMHYCPHGMSDDPTSLK
jgi:hypothetical protein